MRPWNYLTAPHHRVDDDEPSLEEAGSYKGVLGQAADLASLTSAFSRESGESSLDERKPAAPGGAAGRAAARRAQGRQRDPTPSPRPPRAPKAAISTQPAARAAPRAKKVAEGLGRGPAKARSAKGAMASTQPSGRGRPRRRGDEADAPDESDAAAAPAPALDDASEGVALTLAEPSEPAPEVPEDASPTPDADSVHTAETVKAEARAFALEAERRLEEEAERLKEERMIAARKRLTGRPKLPENSKADGSLVMARRAQASAAAAAALERVRADQAHARLYRAADRIRAFRGADSFSTARLLGLVDGDAIRDERRHARSERLDMNREDRDAGDGGHFGYVPFPSSELFGKIPRGDAPRTVPVAFALSASNSGWDAKKTKEAAGQSWLARHGDHLSDPSYRPAPPKTVCSVELDGAVLRVSHPEPAGDVDDEWFADEDLATVRVREYALADVAPEPSDVAGGRVTLRSRATGEYVATVSTAAWGDVSRSAPRAAPRPAPPRRSHRHRRAATHHGGRRRGSVPAAAARGRSPRASSAGLDAPATLQASTASLASAAERSFARRRRWGSRDDDDAPEPARPRPPVAVPSLKAPPTLVHVDQRPWSLPGTPRSPARSLEGDDGGGDESFDGSLGTTLGPFASMFGDPSQRSGATAPRDDASLELPELRQRPTSTPGRAAARGGGAPARPTTTPAPPPDARDGPPPSLKTLPAPQPGAVRHEREIRVGRAPTLLPVRSTLADDDPWGLSGSDGGAVEDSKLWATWLRDQDRVAVLVVAADAKDRRTVARRALACGANVAHAAKSGAAALKVLAKIRVLRKRFDLVLCGAVEDMETAQLVAGVRAVWGFGGFEKRGDRARNEARGGDAERCPPAVAFGRGLAERTLDALDDSGVADYYDCGGPFDEHVFAGLLRPWRGDSTSTLRTDDPRRSRRERPPTYLPNTTSSTPRTGSV